MPRYAWLGMWTGAVLFPVATCAAAYAITSWAIGECRRRRSLTPVKVGQ